MDIRQSRGGGERLQFVRLKCGLHGNRAVVQRHWIPAKDPPARGKKVIGEDVPFQVVHNDCRSCDVAKDPEQFENLIIREVMQE